MVFLTGCGTSSDMPEETSEIVQSKAQQKIQDYETLWGTSCQPLYDDQGEMTTYARALSTDVQKKISDSYASRFEDGSIQLLSLADLEAILDQCELYLVASLFHADPSVYGIYFPRLPGCYETPDIVELSRLPEKIQSPDFPGRNTCLLYTSDAADEQYPPRLRTYTYRLWPIWHARSNGGQYRQEVLCRVRVSF